MLLAALAGLLLLAAVEASSNLPVELLPEVVIVRHAAVDDACNAPSPANTQKPRRAIEAIASADCEG